MKKIKIKLLNFAKKHHWFMKLLRIIRSFIKYLKYGWFYIFPRIDDKLIVFEVFAGVKYADSPKAMYEYMLKNPKYKEFKFYWFFKNPENYKFLEHNKNTKVYKYGGKDYYKSYAKAKYWITNATIPKFIRKSKKQKYIQTWHGTPLKRLGFDIEVDGNAMNNIKDIRKKWATTANSCDYLISPSKFVSEKYTSAFNLKEINPNVKIIEKGYPRNDFLNNYDSKDVQGIKNKLELPKNKKIILYAPTFRDNKHESGVGYIYQTELDFDKLKQELSKEYIVLFRAHYLVANSFDFDKYKGFVYNASDYDDINDLYIVSDLLITDYSSVFFDYSILKRPIIFYMYDLDEYKNNLRDFYIDLNQLPGEIVEKQEQLITCINKTNKFKYDKKYKEFNNTYTYLDDGNASERVVNEIIKVKE